MALRPSSGAAGAVRIETHGCHPLADGTLRLSEEHQAIGLFDPSDLARLDMPEGYRRSVQRWVASVAAAGLRPSPGR